MTRVAVFGAAGRMGRLIAAEAAAGTVDMIQAFDAGDELTLDPSVEVVLDFSLPSAWNDLDGLLKGTGVALVSGTTGLGEKEIALLHQWKASHPVFYSSNMSVGIHVLGRLMELASGMLGENFDRELIEFHHRNKKDSPSGTALSLLKNWDGERVFGRRGNTGERKTGSVGVHAVRGGDVTGEHHLYFMGDGERLTLSHMATDRRVFALGAIRAAVFVAGKPPGMYSMEDMLG
ncbi:MAG: 4-hydroxy-tetrahydrodipicolinate reductase [Candidatus Sabulitectum sp.]|nr:4-hydroxy-tetrahydrodipicolinate reductase [Candidatus Sabulitectum sp.]